MGYLSPTLAARDIKKTIDFYTNKLGFTLGTAFPSPENPEYADLSKDGMVLMFVTAASQGLGPTAELGAGVNLYMEIDGDIDAYYQEIKNNGVKIITDIKDEPYGIRDFTVADPSGYRLTFNKAVRAEGAGGENVCHSCGMPMVGPGDFGGGIKGNDYCVHCADAAGKLKSYDEVHGGMVNFMMQTRQMDRAAAEKAAREYMAGMPAWSGREDKP